MGEGVVGFVRDPVDVGTPKGIALEVCVQSLLDDSADRRKS